MKEVYLYKKLEEKNVQCQTCAHYCVIAPGKRGICKTKENQEQQVKQIDGAASKTTSSYLEGSPATKPSAKLSGAGKTRTRIYVRMVGTGSCGEIHMERETSWCSRLQRH